MVKSTAPTRAPAGGPRRLTTLLGRQPLGILFAAPYAVFMAAIFAYPLVMNYRTMYAQAFKGDRQFGKSVHLGLSYPTDFDIVTPNNDTPYS